MLSLQTHLGGFAGGHNPYIQSLQALCVHALPSGYGLRHHGHVATRLRQEQLVHHPIGGAGLVVHQTLFNRGLKTFGIREATDRQRR